MSDRVYIDTTMTSHDDIDHIAVERILNRDPGPRPRLTEQERQFTARILLGDGVSPWEAAERIGITPATVHTWAVEWGFAAPARKRASGPIECGTRRGYQRHRRQKEPACAPCRAANAAADRRLRTTGSTVPNDPAAAAA